MNPTFLLSFVINCYPFAIITMYSPHVYNQSAIVNTRISQWQRPYNYYGDDALSTKPVMHYQGTAYLCY